MDADRILDALRPVVVVVDAVGTITDVRGGFGGFYGHDLTALSGTSVFDLIAPDHVDELAVYFLESAGRSADALALPLPFRIDAVGADGQRHPVDVVPTGDISDGELRWIVAVVPTDLQTSVARSLEAEMAGAPREQVKSLLTQELLVDNHSYSTRWFLVDLTPASGPAVSTARTEDQPMAEAIGHGITGGWRPWGPVARHDIAPLDVAELPEGSRAVAAARGWRRVAVTPVHVDDSLVAAYLLFGQVPDDYDVERIDANVRSRIQRLVDATALLFARWHDRDRLVSAASRDPLTGLANRDAFADALAAVDGAATLLYLDVDHFKTINDRLGHGVGDDVLVEIARRIATACRPGDVVARFGGDEFVVLLPGVDQQPAREIGERIMASVRAPLEQLGPDERVTVSVGLAPFRGDRDDAVEAADLAMLQAKRDGRARMLAGTPMNGSDAPR